MRWLFTHLYNKHHKLVFLHQNHQDPSKNGSTLFSSLMLLPLSLFFTIFRPIWSHHNREFGAKISLCLNIHPQGQYRLSRKWFLHLRIICAGDKTVSQIRKRRKSRDTATRSSCVFGSDFTRDDRRMGNCARRTVRLGIVF